MRLMFVFSYKRYFSHEVIYVLSPIIQFLCSLSFSPLNNISAFFLLRQGLTVSLSGLELAMLIRLILNSERGSPVSASGVLVLKARATPGKAKFLNITYT